MEHSNTKHSASVSVKDKSWLHRPSSASLLFLFLLSLTLSLFILAPMALYYFGNGDYHGRKVNMPAPNFVLTDIHNQNHSLSQHQGRYSLLYFGYINCDGVCHNQVGTLFNIQQQGQFNNVDYIFVTLDPKRDSQTWLKTYFDDLGENFYALKTDDNKQLKSLTAKYKNYFYADKLSDIKNDYEINHPGNIYLINPKGQIEIIYQNQFVRYNEIINDLKTLQKQEQKQTINTLVSHSENIKTES